MRTEWRCPDCGPVPPLHVAEHIGPSVVQSVADHVLTDAVRRGRPPVPLWCPWPLPPNWTVTGVGWAGDDHGGVRATTIACSGAAPLGRGPADLVVVAEEPGVGLGARLAGIGGLDPGPPLAETVVAGQAAHAKVRADGHPAPLWAIDAPPDRSAYVGEARGMWLYAIAWPASAGYLLAEDVALHDLTERVPPELVYGAPSPYLRGKM